MRATLYSCCQGLEVRRVPVVSGDVPHHWSEAKLFCGAQHVGAAGTEWRAKPLHGFTGRILDGSAAAGKLLADACWTLPKQGRMGHGVIPQQVAGLMDRTGNFRTPAHEVTDQKEGGTHLIAGKQFKQLKCVRVIRTVIKGEGEFLNIGAGYNGAAEELRCGRMCGVEIAPGCKPGNQTRGAKMKAHAFRV